MNLFKDEWTVYLHPQSGTVTNCLDLEEINSIDTSRVDVKTKRSFITFPRHLQCQTDVDAPPCLLLFHNVK